MITNLKLFESEIINNGERGHCFKNVQDYLLDNDLPNALIVHGFVTNNVGKTIEHAWIEDGDTIYDPTTGISTKKEKFKELLNPTKEIKYTFSEAMKLRFKTKNHGPWTEEERRKILEK